MSFEVRLAHWLGRHAPEAFVGALAALYALVLLSWLLLRRLDGAGGPDPLPPRRALGLRLLTGFAAVVVAGLVFAELADALGVQEEMGRFDLALAEALRTHRSPAAVAVFGQVTRLGDTSTLTALCVAVAAWLIWRRQLTLAMAWVLAVAGNGTLNRVLKSVFERVRPVHEHDLTITADGWSFPSGHSSGSVVAYGMLAYIALRCVRPRWHLPVLLLATTLAFATGCSRVFLEVHYASDVLAGFASGLLWLSVCLLILEWLRLR